MYIPFHKTELLEEYAAEQSPSRIEELVKIFIHATKVSGSPDIFVFPDVERRCHDVFTRRYLLILVIFSLFNRWKLGSGRCSLMSDWPFPPGVTGFSEPYYTVVGGGRSILGPGIQRCPHGRGDFAEARGLLVCSSRHPGSFPLYTWNTTTLDTGHFLGHISTSAC